MSPRGRARIAVDDPHRVTRRRGVVRTLVLALIGLLALVEATFVAISSQARVNASNFSGW